MTAHTHDDDRLTVGCPECIRTTRLAEQIARWEQAPLRLVTWHCSFSTPTSDDTETLTFTLKRKVPADADKWEVDTQYAGDTGEAFALALPDRISMDWTTYACETMEVDDVVIGAPIDLEPAGAPQPGLFG